MLKHLFSKPGTLRHALALVWLVFTISLSAWWIYFSVFQLERLKLLDHRNAVDLARYQRMLIWEGGTLILCLFAGAVALMYVSYTQLQQAKQIRDFFLAFSHEIRTPLSNVRLQSDILQEELAHSSSAQRVLQLSRETNRLELQFENSLFMAGDDAKLDCSRAEPLSEHLEHLRQSWPELQWKLEGECSVHADPRALRCIFSNLAQNAIRHGKASTLFVKTQAQGHKISIKVSDNGQGFQGDLQSLSRPFKQHYSGSGSGLGLYLVKKLCRMMKGDAAFSAIDGRLHVELRFPGEMV